MKKGDKWRERINTTKFKMCELGVSLFIAIMPILIPWIFNKNYHIDEVSLILGLLSFTVPILFFLPFQINSTGCDKHMPDKLCKSLEELYRINKNTYRLYKEEIDNITNSIQKAQTNQLYKYTYTPDMKLYTSLCVELLSSFKGNRSDDFFYATATTDVKTIEWFFDYDQISRVFLPKIYDKMKNKKIMEFRRLFIYNSMEDFKNPLLLFLLLLHQKSQERLLKKNIVFAYRFIEMSNFRNLVTNVTNEMGIWGTHFVFIQGMDQDTCGYSSNKQEIKKHKDAFEKLWDNAQSEEELSINYQECYQYNSDSVAYKNASIYVKCIKEGSNFPHESQAIISTKCVADMDMGDIEIIQTQIKVQNPLSIEQH